MNPVTAADPSPTPETKKIAPDDLARIVAATETTTAVRRASESSGGALRGKLLGAVLIAVVGIGASIMSCVGQSFSYRQARALEGIEQQLKELRANCSTPLPREIGR